MICFSRIKFIKKLTQEKQKTKTKKKANPKQAKLKLKHHKS